MRSLTCCAAAVALAALLLTLACASRATAPSRSYLDPAHERLFGDGFAAEGGRGAPAEGATATPTPMAQPESGETAYHGEPISVDLVGSDLHAFFRVIGDISGYNVVVSDDVSGTITLGLQKVPWDQALDLVLKSKGLVKKVAGNVMIITTPEKADYLTRVIKLNYAAPDEVTTSLKATAGEVFLKANNLPAPIILADKRTNAVIITAPADLVARLEPLALALDTAPQQVFIESLILDITLEDSEELGLGWQFSGQNVVQGQSVLGQGTTAFAPVPFGSADAFTYNMVVGNRFFIDLAAKASERKLEVLSAPSIVAANRETATITVGTVRFVRRSSQTGTTGQVTTTFEEKTFGVSLKVTPEINPQGTVTMKIEQTVSDFQSTDADGNPVSFDRKFDTRLLVRDRQTVALGGLIKNRDELNRLGVPLVQKVPVLRDLFGRKQGSGAKTELLVLLTPRLVNTAAEAKGLVERYRDKRRLLRETFERHADAAVAVEPPAPEAGR